MWLAAMLGLNTGFILNICADWLPRSTESKLSGLHRAARCSVLLLMSAGFCACLQRNLGWGFAFAIQMAYCSLLLLIAVIDLEHSLVPNVLVGSGLVLAVGFNILYPTPGLVSALWGAVTGGGIFTLLALARRNALGAGDVKLAFLIGMITGFPGVLHALTLGIVLGGLAAGLLLLTRVRQRWQYMPYAPYLVAGSMATLLYGQHIVNGYATLMGFGG